MHAAMESCPVKTVISGTMGFGLGGLFGLFMASVCFPFPLSLTTIFLIPCIPYSDNVILMRSILI